MLVTPLIVFLMCCLEVNTKRLCGIDNSPTAEINEGGADAATYPWLGMLYYPTEWNKYTTAVVFIMKLFVLADASEVDKFPKTNFRSRARVALGYNCSGPSIGIETYTYHPDYTKTQTSSAICLIQLKNELVDYEFRPICPPPRLYFNSSFYAMVPLNDCLESKLILFKMTPVPMDQCKSYYRRNGLDMASQWPTQTVCARSLVGGTCVWRSGTILTVKSGNRWRLLGFGFHGPGCKAPARFIDYNQYHSWVHESVSRIGRPAITVVDEDHIIIRRRSTDLQRFGTCDYEETLNELYTDENDLFYRNPTKSVMQHVYYNVSLYTYYEYTCIVFRATNKKDPTSVVKPRIRLRHTCTGSPDLCLADNGLQNLEFRVEVEFYEDIVFTIKAFGTEKRALEVSRIYLAINQKQLLNLPSYQELEPTFNDTLIPHWFYNGKEYKETHDFHWHCVHKWYAYIYNIWSTPYNCPCPGNPTPYCCEPLYGLYPPLE